jgi:hypothetical protein
MGPRRWAGVDVWLRSMYVLEYDRLRAAHAESLMETHAAPAPIPGECRLAEQVHLRPGTHTVGRAGCTAMGGSPAAPGAR